MKRCVLTVAIAGTALVAGCAGEPVAPTTTGAISLTIATEQYPTTGATAVVSAVSVDRTVPSPAFDLAGHLESARVQVLGPTNKTLDNMTPGTTVTVDGLSPGSYTVVLEGFVAGEVDYFGQASGVQVRAGQNTTASLSFNSFRPNLSSVGAATTAFKFRVGWPDVASATGYEAEWDTDPGFSSPTSTGAFTGPSFDLDGTGLGLTTHYIRARASNQYVTAGRWSDVASVTVQTDITASGDDPATAASLGFGDAANARYAELNIFPSGDEDWFSVSVCQGDTLVAETFAGRLDPPSDLDPVLELFDAAGTALIDSNDDAIGFDSQLETVIPGSPGSGVYNIVVRGFGSSIGHYELDVAVKPGNLNSGTDCSGSAGITPGQYRGLTSQSDTITFVVSADGTSIESGLKIGFPLQCGTCSGRVTVTLNFSLPLTNGSFSYNGVTITVSGSTTSSTSFSGSATDNPTPPTGCGACTTQNATWTASWLGPAPVGDSGVGGLGAPVAAPGGARTLRTVYPDYCVDVRIDSYGIGISAPGVRPLFHLLSGGPEVQNRLPETVLGVLR